MREPRLDVTGYGLLLWSLRRSNSQYLSCQLGGGDSDFVLLIRDHQRDTVPFAEIGSGMSSLLSLAKLLRVAYVAAGWQAVRQARGALRQGHSGSRQGWPDRNRGRNRDAHRPTRLRRDLF